MNSINFTQDCYINELKIILEDEMKHHTWQEVKNLSNDVTRHRGYLNLLCRKYFLNWLQGVLNVSFTERENLIDYLSIWEFVNGSVIAVNDNRLVLIPTENQDKVSVSIPQEWLKIPEWVGSYYVIVGVNLEENYLDFWGYIGYEDLKERGELDSLNYVINLPYEYLETDLNLLALEYEYGWENIPQVSPLAVLSSQAKQDLMTVLENSLFPRLTVDFNIWLSLMDDFSFRHQLYLSRQSISLSRLLREKTRDILDKGWQHVRDFMGNNIYGNGNLTISAAFRSMSQQEGLNILLESGNYEQILEVVKSVYNWQLTDDLKSTLVDILVNFINHSDNEEIVWYSAFALQYLEESNPLCPQSYGKFIDVNEGNKYGLIINIIPRNNEQISIFVRVLSFDTNVYLPAGLSLEILEENENIFQKIVSEKGDHVIQYKFWGNLGEKFKIRVTINDEIVEETFAI